MSETDVPSHDADLTWCHRSVQGVSRTFAVTVEVLEEPMASYICIGYLLCRIPDTVEDEASIDPMEKARLLRIYDEVLDPGSETDAHDFEAAIAARVPASEARSDDWEVVANANRVLRAFHGLPADVQDAIRPSARELVQGMAMFVERHADTDGLRIKTREELEEYCYYAAGTVGNLITDLVTRGDISPERRTELRETAESFGLLLQFVNIAKDVHDDYATENNVYLPAEWLEEEGVAQENVIEPGNESRVARVVRRTASSATALLDDAQRYLEAVPTTDGNTLAAWAIPFLLAVGTLRELQDDPAAAVTGQGVKVSRQEVFAIVATMRENDHRDALGELRETIADEPYHHATTE